MNTGYLILQDGQVFEGRLFGAEPDNNHDSIGELVFTTSVVGYIETLTDPSYAGQMILQTYPLIGNVGMIPEDFEGPCAAAGYIVREHCDTPSNFRAGETVDAFLKSHGIPGLSGVDTRQLTRIIREKGVLNACICRDLPKDLDLTRILEKLNQYRVTGMVKKYTCEKITEYPAEKETRYRVALIDYGAKRNIHRELQKRGCEVIAYPADITAEEILKSNPDGVMLSNGPGDPEECVYQIQEIKKLLGKIPLFGICLGHQLTALAAGGRTYKLKYGHRGANQPVREATKPESQAGYRTYITSQNHGYAVDADSVPGAQIAFVNANDNTCEGLNYPDLNAFTVQFHPEASGGPLDTSFLFEKFLNLMQDYKNYKNNKLNNNYNNINNIKKGGE